MRQIALLGGSFNPPHLGHLMAAVLVRATLKVDDVWLVPAFHHPFGKPLAPFADRVAMCAAMAADVGPWLSVNEAEASVGGEGRTIELLEWLLPQHPDARFHWIIGSDILGDLPKWRAWDRVQTLVNVVVINRAGHPAEGTLGPPLAEVSSSEVRLRLARGERPVGLVSESVLEVIAHRGLYSR